MLLLQQELFYMNMLDKKLQNKTFNDKQTERDIDKDILKLLPLKIQQEVLEIVYIKEIFNRKNGAYGIRTIKMKLEHEYGIVMNRKKISRIMKVTAVVVNDSSVFNEEQPDTPRKP